jgi:hypothetical protein
VNGYQAQRIRFGILAARHLIARHRMTPDQVDYLEGCEAVGWRAWHSVKAFDREMARLWAKDRRADLRAALERARA